MSEEDSFQSRIKVAIKKRFDVNLELAENLRGLEALAMMHERSVCRSYERRQLSEELVDLACLTALTAPSKSDLQQVTVVRIVSPEIRSAINDLLPDSPWIADAPEFFIVCGDHFRLQCIFETRRKQFPNDHLDSFFNAAVDSGILIGFFLQAVNFLGLGCCPISQIRDQINEISSLLQLPPWLFPVVGLTVGYPNSFEPLSPRLGSGATLHKDVYNRSIICDELDAYDKRRIEHRPYAMQRDPDRFGEILEYGWTEEKFRYYSNKQRADFGNYVRKQGFCLD